MRGIFGVVWAGCAGAALWALSWPLGPAMAQEPARVSPEQEALIRRGVEASNQGQLEEALRFYRAALALGESNVLQLNIGRAYQKMGDCWQAEARYKRALEAPQVQEPPPAQIQEAVARYRAQMPEGCLASLTVACPPEAQLRLGRQALTCNQSVTLAPGSYRLLGRLDGRKVARELTLKPLEEVRVQDLFTAQRAEIPVDAPADAPDHTAQIVGWSLIGGGALCLAGGAWMALEVNAVNDELAGIPSGEVAPQRADALIRRGERAQTLELVGLGVGAGALVGGLLSLWLGQPPPGEEEGAPSLRPLVSGDALGAAVGGRW